MLKQELFTFYARYEHELQMWLASYQRNVTCRKGCGTCCDMSVGLYLPEAFVLADSLTDDQYTRVAAHAERVVHYARATPDYLAGYRHAAIGFCPFLDPTDSFCTIYEFRPANCRHVYSTMSSEYCAKETPFVLEQDAEKRTAFQAQLDPDANEDELPYIAPLERIFSEKYQLYLLILNAKYANFFVQGEMSWLLVLTRAYDLRGMVTEPGVHLDKFREKLRETGFYHDNVLTHCQEIAPDFRQQSAHANLGVLFPEK